MFFRYSQLYIVIIILIVFILSLTAHASTLKVPVDYTSIQDAIDAAVRGDVILLSPGTYTGPGNTQLNLSNLTLQSTDGTSNTTIDCEKKTSAVVGANDATVISGITFFGGGSSGNGGAIRIENASPTIKNCKFEACEASYNGGAIFASGSPSFINCIFFKNSAKKKGGAVYTKGKATFQNCVFEKNNSDTDGGAIHIGKDSKISDCRFLENHSKQNGGAVYAFINPTIKNSLFSKNSSTYSGGGAIYAYNGLTISKSTIEKSRSNYGGGIYLSQGNGIIDKCIIKNNTTDIYIHGGGDGGAIHCDNTQSTQIINTLISGNRSGNLGGAIKISKGSLSLKYCTITHNSTRERFGALVGQNNANIAIKNSIIWGNGQMGIFFDASCSSAIQYSAIDQPFAGTGNHTGNPQFTDISQADYTLKSNSPCINAAQMLTEITDDLNEAQRPQNNAPDMGCYEALLTIPRPLIDQFTVDSGTGQTPLNTNFACIARTENQNQSIASYTMHYGDGSPPETNTSGSFSHQFNHAGQYFPYCTVVDSLGESTTSPPLHIKVAGNLTVPSRYPTIQDAVDISFEECTIVLSDGTYKGKKNTNINLYGKPIRLHSINGPDATIIDCEQKSRALTMSDGNRSHFSGISFINGKEPDGGAIFIKDSSPQFTNCLFSKNTATSRGGAIYLRASNPTFTDTVFSENSATASSYGNGSGGAIFSEHSSTAPKVIIDRCRFIKNSAKNQGGAISYHHNFAISNSIFSENSARIGSAIDTSQAPHSTTHKFISVVSNCTFFSNKSDISCIADDAVNPFLRISNALFWQNTPSDEALLKQLPHIENCNTFSGYSQNVRFLADPMFVSPSTGNFSLRLNSPFIDTGSTKYAPSNSINNITRPHGSGIDMGAYEMDYHSLRPSITKMSISSTEVQAPFGVVLTCEAAPLPGKTLSYVMNYGDGTPSETNSTGVFQHTYTKPGLFHPQCEVFSGPAVSTKSTPVTILVHGTYRVPADFPTIQAAIDAAFDNDTILVADGVYKGEGNRNISFNEKHITLKSENGPENCIIDAEQTTQCFEFRNDSGLLSGFSIINGRQSAVGGILIFHSAPVIENCIIKNNKSFGSDALNYIYKSGGIAICNASKPIVIRNCIIQDNEGPYAGGIRAYQSTLELTDCVIKNNKATSTSSNKASGGGLAGIRSDSNLIITRCTIKGNRANGVGGGIYIEDGSIVIKSSKIMSNESNEGGGIYLSQSKGGHADIINSIIARNNATMNGGGFLYTSPNVIPSLEVASLLNCTLTENGALQNGGAIYVKGESAPSVINSILWNNIPSEVAHKKGAPKTTLSHTIVRGSIFKNDVFHANPQFSDSTRDDWSLAPDSPAIDSARQLTEVQTDILGNKRPHGSGQDMGAYESLTPSNDRPIIDSFTAATADNGDIIFQCSAHDPNGTIASYTMEYGDSSSLETNATGVFTHSYNHTISSYASCMATDNTGMSTYSKAILVGGLRIPQNAETVSDAIKHCKSGSTIILDKGVTYKGNAVINKPLTLSSENWDSDETESMPVLSPDNTTEPTISVQSNNVTIRGLKFSKAKGDNQAALIISDGVSKCLITKNTFEDNHIGLAAGSVQNSEFSNNIFQENKNLGFFLSKGIGNEIVKNTCKKNRIGILLEFTKDNKILNNLCESNDIGILLGADKGSLASMNICNSNRIGIAADEAEGGFIERNSCKKNMEQGILSIQSNAMGVSDNTCLDNKFGIFLSESKGHSVSDNICTNNNEAGIAVILSNSNTIDRNQCSRGKLGITIQKSSNNVLNKNNDTDNEVGIFLKDSSGTALCSNSNSSNSFSDLHKEPAEQSTNSNCGDVSSGGGGGGGGCFIESLH